MAENLSGKLTQILKDSGTREDAICALRTLLSKALEDGEKREAILTKLEELRKLISDEQEDILLEVMDFLVGWCSPHAKLCRAIRKVRAAIRHLRGRTRL